MKGLPEIVQVGDQVMVAPGKRPAAVREVIGRTRVRVQLLGSQEIRTMSLRSVWVQIRESTGPYGTATRWERLDVVLQRLKDEDPMLQRVGSILVRG